MTLSARQKYALRWLHEHDTHAAGWLEKPGYMVVRGRGCSLSIKESDWHALRGLVDGLPVPTKIFGPNKNGLVAIGEGDLP